MIRQYLTFSRPTLRQYAVCAVVLALVIAGTLAYRGLGRWLIVRDTLPLRLDVIFVFGGETARETYGLRLAEQHPEATLLISAHSAPRTRTLLGPLLDTTRTVIVDSLQNTWDEVKFLRRWLAGFRGERLRGHVHEAPDSALRTPQSAMGPEVRGQRSDVRPRDGLLRENPNSALPTAHSPLRTPHSELHIALVSGPYHMRRIKVAAVRMLNRKDLRLHYAPVPLELYGQTDAQYAHWWREPSLRSLVRHETLKTLYYLVRL